MRLINRATVLGLLFDNGELTRVDITAHTGLDAKTTTNIVRELIGEGIVKVVGRRASAGGRKAEILCIRPSSRLACGIWLNPSEVRVVLVNLLGEVLEETYTTRSLRASSRTLLEKAAGLVRVVLEKRRVPRSRVLGVGLAAPGFYDRESGTWLYSAPIPALHEVPIRDELERRLRLPVSIENSTRACALAEQCFGCARELETFLFIYAGYGVSCALVTRNRIHSGQYNRAGELGHWTAVEDGRICNCGNRGCLETVLSAEAATSDLLEAVRAGAATTLSPGRLRRLTLYDVIHACREGDPAAREVIAHGGRHLGRAMASLGKLLDVEMVLGGAFVDAGETFVEAIRGEMRSNTSNTLFAESHTDLRISSLGPSGPAIGAAALPLSDFYKLEHSFLR